MCRNHNPEHSSFVTYHWIVDKSNTTDTTSGAGTAYPSGVPEFIIEYLRCSRCSSFSSTV